MALTVADDQTDDTPVIDRQQRTRDRITEVEAQLQEAVQAVDVAAKASLASADKLTKQRKALATAEQEHSRALSRLDAVESDREQLEGELTTLTRRLGLGSIVRKARA